MLSQDVNLAETVRTWWKNHAATCRMHGTYSRLLPVCSAPARHAFAIASLQKFQKDFQEELVGAAMAHLRESPRAGLGITIQAKLLAQQPSLSARAHALFTDEQELTGEGSSSVS